MMLLEKWRKKSQYFEANGHRIAFWTSRQIDRAQPWLLLIHGFPTSSWDWTAMWPELEKHFNVAAMDMLGFGCSDKPKNIHYSIMDQADLQEAFLAHLGVSEAHLLTHDYGDTVAQELLARNNESGLSFSIKSVCLLNGGLFPEMHRARPIQKLALTPIGFLIGKFLSREKLRKNFDEIFGPETKATDMEIDGHWTLLNENNGAAVFHKLLQYIPERRANRDRWVGSLKEARVPLRLINGGADPVSGKHAYEHYRAEIPNADAVLFGEIGHYPQTEAPDRVFNAFAEFHKTLGTIE